MKATTLAIDLANNVFQLHGVNECGKTVIKKQRRRDQMAECFANLPACRLAPLSDYSMDPIHRSPRGCNAAGNEDDPSGRRGRSIRF
jgi:hypothetical protein